MMTHAMNCPELNPMSEDLCTCGLQYRIALATEQTMHAAWRKRAEEAEKALAEAAEDTADLDFLDGRLKAHFALRPDFIEPANWAGVAGIRIEPQGFISITSIGDKDARYDLRTAIRAAREKK